jgi:serine/threonine protein kinase/Tol biopolymer transport system component
MDSPGPQDPKDDHGDPDSTSSKSAAQSGSPSLPSPSQIGPYKIRELIGEGGMGIIYLAEQTEPVRRRVALKVIKLGMDTKEVVARFEAERQALAMMDHPNIAKVFDAGSTEEGRPYFVMEHVAGVPITKYCDTHRLTTRERVQLFVQVCEAIHHAHHNAIIHRDVKASNVLVKVQDGKPHPKIIDFGVAKAIHHRLTEKTVFTEQGQLIGTPAYMSPEQAEMTGLNIDTRTDIYSLGVLFYELLAGHLPFDPRTLREAGLEGIRRFIRDVDPQKPSTRISLQGDGASEVAVNRGTVPPVLEGQLRGDLDWITMRAMEKDRTRRYQSASEFAEDIERYLNNEPVVAGPPSLAYRARKWMKRNHRVVSVISVAVILLLASYSWQNYRAPKAIPDAEGMTFRKVWEGGDDSGEVSPDNKYLSCVDWETGDLAVREVATGKRRHLTHKKGSWLESNECAGASIWAPDSRQVAYTWYDYNPSFCDLRIIGLNDSIPRTLYHGDYFADWVRPHDWSPDGKHILASFARETGYELGLVSVDDGSVRRLKTLHGIDPSPIGAQFSPDGRYVVYSFPPGPNSTKNDIALLSMNSENEVAIVEHPADDKLLGWAPDGKSILFISDRTGAWDAWMINVFEGQAQGSSKMIRSGIGLISSLGFTLDGFFYYSTPGFHSDIYTTSIDPVTGKIIDPPKKDPLLYEGRNMRPDLSPDGNDLVYISMRGAGRGKSVLCIYSLESGEGRELHLNAEFRYFTSPRWTPDGQSILLWVDHSKKGRGGIYKVDAESGEATILIQEENGVSTWCPLLALDEKSLFYIQKRSKESCQIVMRDLQTGRERELYRMGPFDDNTIVLSPDGQRLALSVREEEDVRALKIFQTAGGEPIELHRFDQRGRSIVNIDWSPDARYIYFERQKPGPEMREWELWRIPSEGGEAENLGLTMHGFNNLCLHPDGKRITFGSFTMHEQVGAIWVMEDFLPEEESQQVSKR